MKNYVINMQMKVTFLILLVYYIKIYLKLIYVCFQLSKECRKEMEYYKLLAREVEKRISILKPYVGSDWDVNEDKTDAPVLPECEQIYKSLEDSQADSITGAATDTSLEISSINLDNSKPHVPIERYQNITSNLTVKTKDANMIDATNIHIDLSLRINENCRNETVAMQNISQNCELPERDCDYLKKQKEVDVERYGKSNERTKNIEDLDLIVHRNVDSFVDIPFSQDGPSSLSSKSFTGSLYDIHSESMKESQMAPMIRQRSYTVLKPSPQLLAHLEVQSLNTGVEMTAISMSESLSNLNSPNKKRRSWDLETAKVKWSSMALELKGSNVVTNSKISNGNINHVTRSVVRKAPQTSPPSRARSAAPDKNNHSSINTKALPKSDPINKAKNSPSQNKNAVNGSRQTKEQPNSSRPVVKEPVSPTHRPITSPKRTTQSKEPSPPKDTTLISNSDDPATRVRELYEKIQKQQLIQMANLVDKQKREQMLLQQVFEEQNSILFKQLKSICPTSPIEVKMAWGDKTEDEGRGPVSLSQLINHKSPERTVLHSPVSNTLTETNNYLNHCDNVLKKSRDITGSIKRQQNGSKLSRTPNCPVQKAEPSKLRSSSPTNRNTSRKLNYDTSASDREHEPILTDRTNDTFADLNVTFPSDSDELPYQNNTPRMYSREMSVKHCVVSPSDAHCRSTDSAIRCLEDSIQHSINSLSVSRTLKPGSFYGQPTAHEVISYF